MIWKNQPIYSALKISKLFIYLLLDKKRATSKELAEHFEVSVRTILRDIETLSAAGIPIYTLQGKGGGISILDHIPSIYHDTLLSYFEC
nr:HTH domain-containing protein [Paenibacillus sp. J2TS4]